jgi:hypothetical protein
MNDLVVRTGIDGMSWLRCSVISSRVSEEPSRLLLSGSDDGACEEYFVTGTMLVGTSASEGAEVNLMISFRADNGARERSSSRLCVASFLVIPAVTTGAFFFLLLRRFVSRLELLLGSADEFLRAFFES